MAKGEITGLHPVIKIEDGRKVLRVGGIIQSIAVDTTYTSDIWDALIPPQPVRNALILGLGGGTVATLMTRAYGPIPITGVELDPAVAWLARREFGLDALPNVEVVVANAFTYVQQCHDTYDAICLDLYTAGKMAHGVLAGNFLRDLVRILAPSGVVMVNLWRSPYLGDQLRHITRYLALHSVTEVDENIIARCGHLTSDISPIARS